MERYIAQWIQPDGSRELSVIIVANLRVARRVASGWLGADMGKVWSHATRVYVARETETHNIPKLDPVAWANREALCRESDRACGGSR